MTKKTNAVEKKLNAKEMKNVKGGISNEPVYRPGLINTKAGVTGLNSIVSTGPIIPKSKDFISISPVPTPN